MRSVPVNAVAMLTLAGGLLVSLSACSGAVFTPDGCAPTFQDGGNSRLIDAPGEFGTSPNAEFPTPLIETGAPQAEIISAGDGEIVEAGDAAVVQLTIYSGESGTSLISTEYGGPGFLLFASGEQPAFGSIIQCAEVGSRVAAVGIAGELIGETLITQNQLQVALDDTVVVVMDVESAYLGRANGVDRLAEGGFPSVVLAPDGRPGITIPSGAPPTEVRVSLLKEGDGARVETGDVVVASYVGVLWETKAVFDSTWERNSPTVLTAASLADDQAGVVPGFAEALIGQKVGSQVIVVIPPEFGYPEGAAPPSIPAGSTLIFVFDVLGIE